jgi:hypothetical protein
VVSAFNEVSVDGVRVNNLLEKRGSNKGLDVTNLQYSCVFAGCHLRRSVVEFAA